MDRSRASFRLGRLAFVAALVLASSLLTACASSPRAELEPATAAAWATLSHAEATLAGVETVDLTDSAATDDTLVCREEVRVGRHFERRRCYTRRQLHQVMRSAQEWLRSDGRYGSVSAVR